MSDSREENWLASSTPLTRWRSEERLPFSCTFDKIKKALEAAGSAVTSAAGLEVMLNTSAAASPILTTAATHVLGNIFPPVAMGAEAVICLEAFWKTLVSVANNIPFAHDREAEWKSDTTSKDPQDSALWHPLRLYISAPVLWHSYEAYQLAAMGTTWSISLAVAAQGYAIIAAYDFIKALKNLYNYRQDPWTATNKQGPYSDVLFQGLKLTGLVLLGFGPACFVTGFSFLAAAALVGLYQHNKFIRKKVNSTGEYLAGSGLAAISFFASWLPNSSSLEKRPPSSRESSPSSQCR